MADNIPPHIRYTRQFNTKIWCNLSHSCGQAISLSNLIAMDHNNHYKALSEQPLDYASVQGDSKLREHISHFHQQANHHQSQLSAEHVVTFSGAQEALKGVYSSILQPGDEVVVCTPNYPSLTAMVSECGATLKPYTLTPETDWQVNIKELCALVNCNTKLIVVNAPHNPTGHLLSPEQQRQLVDIAKQFDCFLLSDDVTQTVTDNKRITSHAYLDYEKSIVISVMSKAFGLGGVRIGWAVTRYLQLIERLVAFKCQSSICTSAVDETLALIAFDNGESIVAENLRICHRNQQVFAEFIENNDLFQWWQPAAGFLSVVECLARESIDTWAPRFTGQTGVMLLPLSLFGVKGNFFRLGLGQQSFAEGLDALLNFSHSELSA
ncbi:pyridoxal phosphate-dependent aminotransferase [Thalassotalea euphylliae]|uniref:pyridoxal phosphate-dependent aminotransferase n=1 Tax=Thalassotalea euphylliae TaxID=1655234 RepID=UPI00363E72A8